ncbi:winged helix-turn-helix domain-containing protein [Hyphococcus flavus]|uniref:Winged helix-turn-helix domain-containing protein n=1 Tax=Hyphococcus flavus TaxID=1866326 RepID=A0AAE9ZCK2_9PROT|nr:winged helix-turn-helix domain-containing protein [Hyphococcus flavus]WDI32269.1 winged helix-turn-helix domain-containing protein [Hyphococcus flavus]
MIYAFGDFELDARAVELRKNGSAAPVEPQVFALLALLAENHDRMVSKDEIIEKIWDGRIVSEAALTSRVKSARAALGDDGKAQKFIKTVHGKGFRFVGEVKALSPRTSIAATSSAPLTAPLTPQQSKKPSIAVLPFRLVGVAGPYAAIADALPDELIFELSRLRWLFVIARGSSFRFRGGEPDMSEVGAALGVRYCLTGFIEIVGDSIAVTVSLADTRDGGVIWGERYQSKLDDIYDIRSQIVASIVSSLEQQISVHEAQAARLLGPENLDAWSAYHIGLQHLYRFNNQDNEAAAAMFERAIALSPNFARAHAGLSSARFQDVFVQYKNDIAAARMAARVHAEKAVDLDPLDPFANFVMGRVHWIENNVAGGGAWLERAIRQSPNYAQGIYASAWADTVAGRASAARENVDLALNLSPLDPFRYAMLGVRAFTHFTDGEMAEAARLADEAARTPGAHVLIAMIAVGAHEANGDRAKAETWARNVRERNPAVSRKEFFMSFPFEHDDTRERISKALEAHGF